MKGAFATMEPLQNDHARELWPAASDPQIWQFMPNAPPGTVGELDSWIQWRVGVSGRDDEVWLIRDAEGTAAGTTSLFDHQPENKKAEIGWTWIGRAWHGSPLNKQAKRLLLAHAFEELELGQVQLKCDARNRHSFHAMTAIGAIHEGTLRQHDVLWDGFVRDVELFSITAAEWPSVRAGLDRRLR
jgi:RimJ/RimL family protein N-acetyltransferase